MLGAPPWGRRERTERFEEFVALMDLLLRDPCASSDGSYYSADEARMYPGCVQQPRVPLAIAASGRRGMILTARHGDWWVTTGSRTRPDRLDPAEGSLEVRRQIEVLEAVCESVGRDPAELRRLVVTGPTLESGLRSAESFAEVAGRYSAVGVTDLVVHWPRPDEPYRADLDTFEQIFAS
jgi:alkanesulfonate monooxygenase SsuD/methylene tetrahydromethanopterin reductase-like flavin-dependent oxidoreductase (luciferase family)